MCDVLILYCLTYESECQLRFIFVFIVYLDTKTPRKCEYLTFTRQFIDRLFSMKRTLVLVSFHTQCGTGIYHRSLFRTYLFLRSFAYCAAAVNTTSDDELSAVSHES